MGQRVRRGHVPGNERTGELPDRLQRPGPKSLPEDRPGQHATEVLGDARLMGLTSRR